MKKDYKKVHRPAIDKAIDIMRILQAAGPLRNQTICETLNFHKATSSRILHTLMERRIVKKTLDGKFDLRRHVNI